MPSSSDWLEMKELILEGRKTSSEMCVNIVLLFASYHSEPEFTACSTRAVGVVQLPL